MIEYRFQIQPNLLPTSLTSLSFGSNFNAKIYPFALPQSLTSLKLGFYYSRKIGANILPCNLKKIVFGDVYNHPFYDQQQNVLPDSLQHLELGYLYKCRLFNENGFSILPKSLICLIFSGAYDHSLMYKQEKNKVFPDSIEYLEFGNWFNQPLSYNNQSILPHSLKTLKLGIRFDQKIHNYDHSILPESLTDLELGEYFAHPLFYPNILVQSVNLKFLTIHKDYPNRQKFIPSSIPNVQINFIS